MPDPDPVLLEQYKLAVATTDNVSGWRQSTNQFFFTLVSAMFAAIGWWVKDGDALWDSYAPLCFAGIAACAAWWALVRQYRAINRAKFQVIQDMEKQLSYAFFTREWKALDGSYISVSKIEQVVPLLGLLGFVAVVVFA